MTDQEIYELLVSVDNGYKLIATEYLYLSTVKSLTWRFIKGLPRSMGLLKSLENLDLAYAMVSDISALSGLTTITNLKLSGTGMSDISALSGFTSLTNLDLSWCRNLMDINALSGLTKLTHLDLSETSVINIDALSELKALINLNISGSVAIRSSLTNIKSLKGLVALKELNLSYTSVFDLECLDGLTSLKYLSLNGTCVSDIRVISGMTSLIELGLAETRVNDISNLSGLKKLTKLDLSYCNIEDISVVSDLKLLKFLNMRGTALKDISALSGLSALKYLSLAETNVNDISTLSNLTALETLDLRYLCLNSIPEWVIRLNLDFFPKAFPDGKGIYIYGLQLDEQLIQLFSQDREMIHNYYRSQDKVPINECKVIFLGDAESGKTHSINRLLQKGERLINFDGNSTPGIEITVSSTTIEGTDIAVNYWDFGGQEIQHSMHRMFLTERTVYVVFLNARQDPLDERARYWIENINSFASGAPILLVINKMDQNDRPKFNEEGIKTAYKDQIKGIVKMSALNDSKAIFNEKLQGSIDDIIKELSTASTMVPKSWKILMEKIRTMPEHYLTAEEFQTKCLECNVSNYKNIHDNLVDIFQVIGVSFCYYNNRAIADYMLLNPRWLVNAIYTIITNSEVAATNGVITQNDLYDLLLENTLHGTPIKRVIPDLRYKGREVNYILEVIRMFRLSYPLKDGSEFFPMLCDGNEKISVNESVSQNALHYIFKYTYLPPNVLHHLIVEKQRNLDYNYVWYSGAVFRSEAQGQIAYVHTIGNNLHIYVDCQDSFYNPNEYLTPIIDEVRGINKDMGLQAEELIGLQIRGKKAEIQVDLLIGNLSNGIERVYISKDIGVVDIRKTLFRYNDHRPKGDEMLFNSLISSLNAMQNEQSLYNTDENSRNRFVSHQLRSAGYYCEDQVPGGLSATGKSIGIRDGIIKDDDDKDVSIFEGLNLNSLVKATINTHLDKLLVHYNPQGLPYGFMLVYLDCPRDHYGSFIDKYKDYIKDYAPDTYECVSAPAIVSVPTNGQLLTCIRMDYECGRDYYTIYHIVVRVAAS